ncbi:MAG: universal stress protein [Dehalococcoidia bacterium]|nr:universal stress protein [Dehalococcoidia bacterium]
MFQRILLPVDGSPRSERAVPYAKGLATALDAEVLVCRVITKPITAFSTKENQQAAEYVDKIAEQLREGGVAVKTQVRRGEAPLEIEKAALEWGVDAIVMATRSRRRLEKLMLGSVADAVVRDSRLPVLLVSSRRLAKQSARSAA